VYVSPVTREFACVRGSGSTAAEGLMGRRMASSSQSQSQGIQPASPVELVGMNKMMNIRF
jgi:hypothetical protein